MGLTINKSICCVNLEIYFVTYTQEYINLYIWEFADKCSKRLRLQMGKVRSVIMK